MRKYTCSTAEENDQGHKDAQQLQKCKWNYINRNPMNYYEQVTTHTKLRNDRRIQIMVAKF